MLSVYDILNIVKRIKYKDWNLHIHYKSGPEIGPIYLQVSFHDGEELWTGRKWLLSLHMTLSEIVQTAFKAIMTAEEHEIREKFLFDGKAVLGPHIDIESLAMLMENGLGLDVRENVKA